MKILEDIIDIIGCRENMLRVKGENIVGYDSFLLEPFYDHDEISLIKLKGRMNFLSNENMFNLNVDIERKNLDILYDEIVGMPIRISPYGYINPSLIPSVEADMPPSDILTGLGWNYIVISLDESRIGGNTMYFLTKLSEKKEFGDYKISMRLSSSLTDEDFARCIAIIRNRFKNNY